MKRTLTIIFTSAVLVCTLSACEKSAQEKLAEQQLQDREKEIQRLNAIGKAEDAAYAKILGRPASSNNEAAPATQPK